MTSVPALPGHVLYLLLLQVALILAVSRLLAEGMKRLGQPPVIGELLAGVVLGPSLFGWLAPGPFAAIFPAQALQVHLLETMAWIGMVLLLLLTGLETDVRLLRHLGRSALLSSVLGMLVPFGCGFGLGLVMPEHFLADPSRRLLFSAFLATAMAISAMPVIAKILIDLDLTKRNIGVIILSAGVVDDTTGWLILSLIAGIAGSKSAVAMHFIATLGFTALFLIVCVFVLFPLLRWLFRIIDDRARTQHAELTAIVVVAFVLAALTERIGIHAVFGAFVAGCLLMQVPRIRPATLHRLESVSMSIFAPIFFGLVGLKVDLRTVGSGKMLLIVLVVATLGKLIGCTLGGLWGRMSFWESFSIGVAMNTRGAMELVLALIGLQLGILNSAMFAIIVMVAIVTSFAAPIFLRLTLRKVKMSAEEEARLAGEGQGDLFDRGQLKALIPTAGGPHALVAGRFAATLLRGSDATITVMYVEAAKVSLWRRMRRRFRPDLRGRNLAQHLDTLKTFGAEQEARLEVRRFTESDPVGFITKQAAGYDLLLLGARQGDPLRSALLGALLEQAPCHIALVRGRGPAADYRRILVATNGSYFSQAAVELAVRYAESAQAAVTILYSMESVPDRFGTEVEGSAIDEGFHRMMATTLLMNLSPALKKTSVKVDVVLRESSQLTPPLLSEARSGLYTLVVVGAENRAVQHRIGVGYDLDRLMAETPCTVMVVVPKIIRAMGAEHA